MNVEKLKIKYPFNLDQKFHQLGRLAERRAIRRELSERVAPGAPSAAKAVPKTSASKNSSTANAACPSRPPKNSEELQPLWILGFRISLELGRLGFGAFLLEPVLNFIGINLRA